ncbi:MAG: hypothetical protein IKO01_02485 [Kiritimatiellae bacterium]|nr:hypothetical protein [Kiritimatiellia bacterium]
MALLKPESYRRGGLSSTALQVVAQGLAFVFSLVMAHCFGAIAPTDVFNYCVGTFTMVSGFMLSLDSAVLIPEAMRRREQESPESAVRFLNFFLFLFGGITLVLTVLAALSPVRFLTAISQFDPVVLEANRGLILWVVPLFLLQLLAQYTNSILVSYRFFSLPAKWAVVCRVLNIAFVLAFSKVLGVVALAQSMILGFLLQLGVALWLMRTQLGWSFALRWPGIRWKVWRDVGYTEVGIVVIAMALFSPLLMASAAPEGFVTAMNYALKLSQVPEYLLSAQIALIIGIRLNELASKGDDGAFRETYGRLARFMLWFCTPLACLMFVAAPDAVPWLLQRGAYTAEAARLTAVLFRGMIAAFPAIVYNAILLQIFAAKQKVFRRNLMDVIMNVSIFSLLWLLVPRMGLERFPWVKTGCMYGVHFVWMLAMWWTDRTIPLAKTYGFLVLHVAVNAAIAAAVWHVLGFVPGWPALARIALAAALYAGLWGGLQCVWKWDRTAWGYALQLVADAQKRRST